MDTATGQTETKDQLRERERANWSLTEHELLLFGFCLLFASLSLTLCVEWLPLNFADKTEWEREREKGSFSSDSWFDLVVKKPKNNKETLSLDALWFASVLTTVHFATSTLVYSVKQNCFLSLSLSLSLCYVYVYKICFVFSLSLCLPLSVRVNEKQSRNEA